MAVVSVDQHPIARISSPDPDTAVAETVLVNCQTCDIDAATIRAKYKEMLAPRENLLDWQGG